jgi:hypothetical protein
MITQIVILLAGLIAVGLALWPALRSQPTPPAERVAVPVEESREHMPR